MTKIILDGKYGDQKCNYPFIYVVAYWTGPRPGPVKRPVNELIIQTNEFNIPFPNYHIHSVDEA